ncbi:hypothetical protein [Enterococcus dispar]
MTKWIVSVPIRDSDLQKNFVCFNAKELDELLEEFSEATVQEVNSNCNSYSWKDDQLVVLNEEPVPFSLANECLTLGEIQSINLDTEQYIQVKGVYYSLDEFNHIGDYLLGRNLTDDQQVVLEYLKHYYTKSNLYDIRAGKEPMQAVDRVLMEAESDATGLSDVYYRLTEKQQFQVLAAFAEWGLQEGEE